MENNNQEMVQETVIVEGKPKWYKSKVVKGIAIGAGVLAVGFIAKAILGSNTKADNYVGEILLEDGTTGFCDGDVLYVEQEETVENN